MLLGPGSDVGAREPAYPEDHTQKPVRGYRSPRSEVGRGEYLEEDNTRRRVRKVAMRAAPATVYTGNPKTSTRNGAMMDPPPML